MKKRTMEQKIKVHSALYLSGIAMILIGCALSSFENYHPLLWVGISILFLSVAYRLTAMKCPSCGSNMAQCRTIPKFCPDCGERLR